MLITDANFDTLTRAEGKINYCIFKFYFLHFNCKSRDQNVRRPKIFVNRHVKVQKCMNTNDKKTKIFQKKSRNSYRIETKKISIWIYFS